MSKIGSESEDLLGLDDAKLKLMLNSSIEKKKIISLEIAKIITNIAKEVNIEGLKKFIKSIESNYINHNSSANRRIGLQVLTIVLNTLRIEWKSPTQDWFVFQISIEIFKRRIIDEDCKVKVATSDCMFYMIQQYGSIILAYINQILDIILIVYL